MLPHEQEPSTPNLEEEVINNTRLWTTLALADLCMLEDAIRRGAEKDINQCKEGLVRSLSAALTNARNLLLS